MLFVPPSLERATDADIEKCRKRYAIFKTHYAACLRLKQVGDPAGVKTGETEGVREEGRGDEDEGVRNASLHRLPEPEAGGEKGGGGGQGGQVMPNSVASLRPKQVGFTNCTLS